MDNKNSNSRKIHEGKTIPRETPKKKISRKSALALASVIIISSSGCVTAPEEPHEASNTPTSPNPGNPPNEEASREILQSSITTSTALGSDLRIDVFALERLENNLLRLQLGVTNESSDPFDLGFGLSDTENYLSASNVSLIDDINQQHYLSYRSNDGKCFCSSLDSSIEGGKTEDLWVIYPEPPENIEKMTVVTPLSPPILDIPISESSETVETSNLAEPKILDLTLISDSLEDQTGRSESGDEVSIILSSDVLFETNSSELTDDASDILNQVAREIDDSSSNVVSIDGHADNTGNDSINLPLSKERAESVESSLADLINREGVTFEVEGHGSAAPIADNDTEEGRERNRRVSVTFEK
ncbi:OmpA family protein [Nocardiopsis alba]|uniref:OmpA family protein n=1 Tax=Nocardiopsis alba TaxID=53437 RepID=UPI00146164AC|nr:OmpA family protein [Nocardiopsis alba]